MLTYPLKPRAEAGTRTRKPADYLPIDILPQNCKPLTFPRKPHLRTRTLSMVLTYQLLKVEADTVWSCLRDPSIAPLEEANCLCSPKTLSRSALAGRDSNPRTRMGADLQSAAFNHFATYQYICAAGRIRTYLLLESNTKIC